MCGIIGYIGKKDANAIILEGLKNLEYRGYDSAGIATISQGKTSILKCKGRIAHLEKLLKKKKTGAYAGIGHTRWATHGEPSKVNAHPHTDCSGKIIVVHNGIIENYDKLKNALEKSGCKFKSQTDTEVIAHLISKFYRGDLKQALIKTVRQLKGSYALCVLSTDEPDKILAARCDSPLVIGLGKGENFIVSDVPAVSKYTKKIVYIKKDQIALVTKDCVKLYSLDSRSLPVKVSAVKYDIDATSRGKFKHFMLKEIFEQPKVLSNLLSSHTNKSGNIKFKDLNLSQNFFKRIDNIIIVACGTAYHAGLVGKYIIESMTRIPVWVDLSSEFRYRDPIIKKKTLVIAISQSGETADTLAAVKKARKDNVKVLSICNVLGSSLTRNSDDVIYTHAGPEIGVASTKAYTAQLMVLYLFTLYIAKLKSSLKTACIKKAISSLGKIPTKQRNIINNHLNIKRIAKRHLHFGAFLYLGRNINFPTALEGALKLKEISYIPAEGYAAGEMKHGPIALIDEYRGVVCVVNDSVIYDKMISNIQEILARKGKIIAIATTGNKKIKAQIKEVIYIPKTDDIFSSLVTVIPLQIFAYYVADLKGYDVDKPRNLAKSVTVE